MWGFEYSLCGLLYTVLWFFETSSLLQAVGFCVIGIFLLCVCVERGKERSFLSFLFFLLRVFENGVRTQKLSAFFLSIFGPSFPIEYFE